MRCSEGGPEANIEAFEFRVKSQNIRVFAHLMHGKELHTVQIEHCKRVILFPRNERKSILLVKMPGTRPGICSESVVPNPRERYATDEDLSVGSPRPRGPSSKVREFVGIGCAAIDQQKAT